MSTDLTMLAWTTALMLVLPLIYVSGLVLAQNGLSWGLGNREQPFVGEAAWGLRARRAHANLLENLLPFAAVVLIAHVAGKANATTAFGAQLFFWSRLAYTGIYIAGLTPWRTLAYAVGQFGIFLILLQIL